MSQEDRSKQSFWTTLPGILSGIAAVLAAAGSIFAIVHAEGSGPTLAKWVQGANAICEQATSSVRNLGIPADPVSQLRALPQVMDIVTQANQQIEALPRPSDEQAQAEIDHVLDLASQIVIDMQNALASLNAGDLTRAQSSYANGMSLSVQLQQVDSELGANVCARGLVSQ
jgi:hypothetical protein